MKNIKTIAIAGFGDRGSTYADYALKNPGRLRVAAVAEPDPLRRAAAAKRFSLTADQLFESWEPMLAKPRLADGIIVSTQDQMHRGPATAALEAGYDILLEKPMGLSPGDCIDIARAAEKSGSQMIVCHVLRYTAFFEKIKSIIDQGILGDIHSILHAENVSYAHMAHSYVRGNWRNSGESSPMILAKCSHDMDLIYWFADSSPRKISSFGGLSHFTPANRPDGAPPRCTDGCPAADCPYNAVDTYLYGRHVKQVMSKTGYLPMKAAMGLMLKAPALCSILPGFRRYHIWPEWPTDTITADLSRNGILRSLREGPYGRCVYGCDNDQVDHQETIIEFENGITAVLRMHGHSHHEGRTIRIDGSKGSLRGSFGDGGRLEVHLHSSGKRIKYRVKTDFAGHGEGDYAIMESFTDVLYGRKSPVSASDSLAGHLMSFAADRARRENTIVEL